MDDEAETVSGFSHRENNGSYKDFLMDVEDLEEAVGSDAEEHSTKRLHQEQNDSLKNNNIQHTGSSGTDDELRGADSSGFLHAHPVCVSQDSWTVRGEEHIYENLLHPCFAAEGSISQRIPGPSFEYLVYLNDPHNVADCPINRPANPSISPVSVGPHHSTPIPSSLTAISASVSSTVSSMMTSFITDTYSPIGFMCGVNSSVTDPLMSTSKSPCCSDQNPISAAAHLHLLGESLSLIGCYLQETDASTLENIAYVMPGL